MSLHHIYKVKIQIFLWHLFEPDQNQCAEQKVFLYLLCYIAVGDYYYVIFHAVHKTKQLQQHTREMFLTEKKERKKEKKLCYILYLYTGTIMQMGFSITAIQKKLVFKTIKMF